MANSICRSAALQPKYEEQLLSFAKCISRGMFIPSNAPSRIVLPHLVHRLREPSASPKRSRTPTNSDTASVLHLGDSGGVSGNDRSVTTDRIPIYNLSITVHIPDVSPPFVILYGPSMYSTKTLYYPIYIRTVQQSDTK